LSYDTKAKKWNSSIEESIFVSNAIFSADEYQKAIGDHWSIENRNHYVRDVTMGEDNSRIRVKPEIMSKLRSIGLNLLRANGVKNVRRAMYSNCCNLGKVLRMKYLHPPNQQ
jgi:predicted transposase YbfD/YdcC